MKKENVVSMLDVERETDCQNDQLGDQTYAGCQGVRRDRGMEGWGGLI